MPTTLLPPRFSELPTALHLGRTGLHRQKWSSSLGFNNWWTIGCKKSFKTYVDKINFVLSCTLCIVKKCASQQPENRFVFSINLIITSNLAKIKSIFLGLIS